MITVNIEGRNLAIGAGSRDRCTPKSILYV